MRCGQLTRAHELFGRAATAAEEDDDATSLARAALGLGGVWLAEQRSPIERERILGLQRRALDGLPPEAAALRLRLGARSRRNWRTARRTSPASKHRSTPPARSAIRRCSRTRSRCITTPSSDRSTATSERPSSARCCPPSRTPRTTRCRSWRSCGSRPTCSSSGAHKRSDRCASCTNAPRHSPGSTRRTSPASWM